MTPAIENDQCSEFGYDSDKEFPSDPFSLTELKQAVNRCVEKECDLVKLAEGGYHKAGGLRIYEACSNEESIGVLARVAAPAFPRDKLESEIATMKYIASNTTMHIPKVFGWNLDSDNPVGLEYMILGKISGVSANSVWDTLPLELKQVMVSEIADFIVQLFRLRSDTAGSLYTDDDGKQVVGPIIATPFYRALDGWVRLDSSTYRELASLRGPFTTVTGYLRSFLEAELFLVREYRQRILEHELHGDEERLELGRTVLEKAVELCSLYPGEICVSEPLTSPEHPFSIRLDDFRLSNMMIDEETGHVTGIIDFEGATVAPLWECAYLPRWLQDYDEWDGSHEGGSAEDKQLLRNLFMKRIQELDPDGEWIRALEQGRPFREFTNLLSFNVGVWMNQEKWVRERLEWAKTHPGIAFPSEIDTLS